MQSLARRRRKNHGFEPHIGKTFWLGRVRAPYREHSTFGPSVFAVCLLAPYRGLQRSWGPFRAPSGKAALDASCPARHGRGCPRVDCGVSPGGSSLPRPVPSLPGSFCSRRFYLLRLRGNVPASTLSCPSGVSRSSARSLPRARRGAPAPIMRRKGTQFPPCSRFCSRRVVHDSGTS